MESIKHSIALLSEQFNSQMAEFQKNLQSSSIPASSPSSNIAAQFSAFRSFVLNSLEGLQLQVDLLSKQYDQMEMRTRRKILLVHGIPENKTENICDTVISKLKDHLDISDINPDSVKRCHRMGSKVSDKPRAVLIKFKDISSRNQIWYNKTNLKNTGITVSEFLTKERHSTFTAARQRFGLSKCWTKDGRIFVIAPNGKRHLINSMADLDTISTVPVVQGQTCGTSSTTINPDNRSRNDIQKLQGTRPKRNAKK